MEDDDDKKRIVRKVETYWQRHIIGYESRKEVNVEMLEEGREVARLEVPRPGIEHIQGHYPVACLEDCLDFLNGFDDETRLLHIKEAKEELSERSEVHIELAPIGEMP